jgi:hypothetical protein
MVKVLSQKLPLQKNACDIDVSRSNVMFAGLQLEGEISKEKRLEKIGLAGFIFNNSVFYHISSQLIIGIEALTYLDVSSKDSFVAFYPQAHIIITPQFEVQIGFGLLFEKAKFIPQFVHKTIYLPTAQ